MVTKQMMRSIFYCMLMLVLSACAVSSSPHKHGANHYIYPYKCTYKGKVVRHQITAKEPLNQV